jgi:peptide/nickel transport system permease protein
VNWVADAAQGDLGYSPFRRREVVDLIAAAWMNTLVLALSAAAIGLTLGITLGTLAAVNRGKWIERVVSIISVTGISVPSYWVSILLIIVFSANLKVLPSSGMHGPEGGTIDFLKHLIMPAFALSLVTIGVTARMTRASLMQTFGDDFVATLRAKGLREWQVLLHVAKNASGPILTVAGLQVGFLLGGSVLVETIFSWPGLGQLIYTAISARDLKVIQAAVLFVALGFVLINLTVDVIQALLDPRLRKAT